MTIPVFFTALLVNADYTASADSIVYMYELCINVCAVLRLCENDDSGKMRHGTTLPSSPPPLSTGHNWSLFAERRDHFKLVRGAVGAIGDRHCQHQRVRDFVSLARRELEAEFAHKHGCQELRLEHGHVHTKTLPRACLEHLT